jgi:hypothetical protein
MLWYTLLARHYPLKYSKNWWSPYRHTCWHSPALLRQIRRLDDLDRFQIELSCPLALSLHETLDANPSSQRWWRQQEYRHVTNVIDKRTWQLSVLGPRSPRDAQSFYHILFLPQSPLHRSSKLRRQHVFLQRQQPVIPPLSFLSCFWWSYRYRVMRLRWRGLGSPSPSPSSYLSISLLCCGL